ncbi:hypothetical protein [Neobacillus vireti]|uniref:hypothetical protein n=1 Tax=Neobacillus vireti TaxID=220686 RepID=UPI0003F98389|nr:hypothetical protein [Neobacillus vireti]
MNTFEALEWLKNNKNPSALATDRFGETADAKEHKKVAVSKQIRRHPIYNSFLIN